MTYQVDGLTGEPLFEPGERRRAGIEVFPEDDLGMNRLACPAAGLLAEPCPGHRGDRQRSDVAEPLRARENTVAGWRCGVISLRNRQVEMSAEASPLRCALRLRREYLPPVLNNRRNCRMFDLAFY